MEYYRSVPELSGKKLIDVRKITMTTWTRIGAVYTRVITGNVKRWAGSRYEYSAKSDLDTQKERWRATGFVVVSSDLENGESIEVPYEEILRLELKESEHLVEDV